MALAIVGEAERLEPGFLLHVRHQLLEQPTVAEGPPVIEIAENIGSRADGQRWIEIQEVSEAQIGHVGRAVLETLDHLGIGLADLPARKNLQLVTPSRLTLDLVRRPQDSLVVSGRIVENVAENERFGMS